MSSSRRHRGVLPLFGAGTLALCAVAAPVLGTEMDGSRLAVEPEGVERTISRALESASGSAAVGMLQQAERAHAGGDHALAATLYEQLRAQDPGSDHLLRRWCREEIEQEHKVKAVDLCEAAAQEAPTPENLAMLAAVLSTPTELYPAFPAEVERAERLARRAARLAPHDFAPLRLLCDIARMRADASQVRDCATRFEARFPDRMESALYASLTALDEGRFSAAHRSLTLAHSRGLAEESYRGLLRRLPVSNLFYLGDLGAIVGAWLALLPLLMLAGAGCSSAALRIAGDMDPAPGRAPSPIAAAGGALDALLLRLAWLYCCVSLPLLLLSLLGLGVVLVVFYLSVNVVPFGLLATLLIAVGLLTSGALRGIDRRAVEAELGLRLDPVVYPRLRALLDDVAARVGTRAADAIEVTPGAVVALEERRGREGRGPRRERVVVLGLGLLEGLRLGPLRALLAHEHGHLSRRGAPGGRFALRVRRSFRTMARALEAGGGAVWYNPVWHFVCLNERLFLLLSRGAACLHETIADRRAAAIYGSASLERGLRFAVERAVRFESHLSFTLCELEETGRPLDNLYT
jgi:hypothetical protein